MPSLDTMTAADLAACIDHTLLRADAAAEDFRVLCAEAQAFGFHCVMVNPARLPLCRELLSGSGVKLGTVVGFPLGATTIADKVSEARRAIEAGADEVDYVLNIGALRDGNLEYIEQEMVELVAACRLRGAVSKVIFETCYLTEAQIAAAAKIAAEVRPTFIKTSTGFGSGGAAPETVALMAKTVGRGVKVKAAGGIRTWADCRAMLASGAERIGASAGVKILQEFRAEMEH